MQDPQMSQECHRQVKVQPLYLSLQQNATTCSLILWFGSACYTMSLSSIWVIGILTEHKEQNSSPCHSDTYDVAAQ